MQIERNDSVGVVVKRSWANLRGVKMYLRRQEDWQAEIRGVDDSHILFATILDANQCQRSLDRTDGRHANPGFRRGAV
jgi:hypothetical protein